VTSNNSNPCGNDNARDDVDLTSGARILKDMDPGEAQP
jgi:hypothetical protein